ncbi:MAG: winged helix-turn-helix transcriptional regulator, partial [Actinomycetospora chiangmaiensis]|nr:winged helix-turn-helix transcriptional regulator [Actinomycetospora chiangmaiensis]
MAEPSGAKTPFDDRSRDRSAPRPPGLSRGTGPCWTASSTRNGWAGLDASSPRTLSVSARIGADLKAQIADGTYPPGSPLPSTRALGLELGVSRTTVTAAYDQLVAEGYLVTRPGSRTRVAPGILP